MGYNPEFMGLVLASPDGLHLQSGGQEGRRGNSLMGENN